MGQVMKKSCNDCITRKDIKNFVDNVIIVAAALACSFVLIYSSYVAGKSSVRDRVAELCEKLNDRYSETLGDEQRNNVAYYKLSGCYEVRSGLDLK